MSEMLAKLRERFSKEERCNEPSCSEGGKATGGKITYPPNRSEIGNASWRYIHSRAANYDPSNEISETKWLWSFVALFPCQNCARDFVEICHKMPPVFTSRESYEKWWIQAHNAVNIDIGKKVF
jgi:mitochondrial FAD-linked sulfhydryl oxidase